MDSSGADSMHTHPGAAGRARKVGFGRRDWPCKASPTMGGATPGPARVKSSTRVSAGHSPERPAAERAFWTCAFTPCLAARPATCRAV